MELGDRNGNGSMTTDNAASSTQLLKAMGVTGKETNDQLLIECPSCGKGKLFVSLDKSTYQCKVCGVVGNEKTIVSLFFDLFKKCITDEHRQELATLRGLPVSAFNDPALGFNPYAEKIVWASYNEKGRVCSLRVAQHKDGKLRPLSLAKAKLGCVGLNDALDRNRSEEPIYIVEGEWDRHAWNWILAQEKQPGVTLGVPGAGSWKPEWAPILRTRIVRVLYDHDQGGMAGAKRLGKLLAPYADTIEYLHWIASEVPEGYDINDLARESSPAEAFKYVIDNLQEVPPGFEEEEEEEEGEVGAPAPQASQAGASRPAGKKPAPFPVSAEKQAKLPPISLEELHGTYKKWLKVDSCDLLDIACGVIHATHLPGSPLWLYIVAPPAGAKSETLMPASAFHGCKAISNLTSKTLVSGFKMPDGGDPSLLAELDGKAATLVVKDLTPILQSQPDERQEIFGTLRDAYDGSHAKPFGNGVLRKYTKLRFNMLAGVTPTIDAYDSVAFGERILKFRSDKETGREDDLERAMTAINNTGKEEEMQAELRMAIVRSLNKRYLPGDEAGVTAAWAEFAAGMALLTASLRAVAPSDKFTSVQAIAPLQEVPTRLGKQFTKLAQGLSLHFGTKDLMDPRIRRLVARVAIHTPDIITTRLVQVLHMEQRPLRLDEIVARMPGMSQSTILSILDKTSLTGITKRVKPVTVEQPKLPGIQKINPTLKTTYELTPYIAAIITKNRVFSGLPKGDPLHIAGATVALKPGKKP